MDMNSARTGRQRIYDKINCRDKVISGNPKNPIQSNVWLAATALGFGQDAPATKATIRLVSAEVMTGTAGAVREGSLSLITEYGPVRIPSA